MPPRPPRDRYSDSRYSDSSRDRDRYDNYDDYNERPNSERPNNERPSFGSGGGSGSGNGGFGGGGNGGGKSPIGIALNWGTAAILAAVMFLGIGLGIFFSSGTTSDVGNVATRYDIDRSAPNPEICVQFGASAISVDLRAFVTLSPFSVFISQPRMQPGCVLRGSNWEVLQSRNLVSSDDVNQCRRRMNTFGFTGDLNNAADKAKVDCVYQNDAARNLFLPQTGNNAAPPEVEQFK
jgi:hypothetical protein